jgi:LysM repeat protein
MTTAAPGKMERLSMKRYTIDSTGKISIDDSLSFTVMLNPADLKRNCSISYSHDQAMGQKGHEPKFSAVGKETLAFSIVIDGTGAVPVELPGPVHDVATQLRKLNDVVYRDVAANKEISRVYLLWGKLSFHGRLESMATNYTLFTPSGIALRAKVDLAFAGATSAKEAELVADRSSPNMSKVVEVRQGDTLALLSARVYGTPAYYLDVARANNLSDVRGPLKAGSTLVFPPLVGGA